MRARRREPRKEGGFRLGTISVVCFAIFLALNVADTAEGSDTPIRDRFRSLHDSSLRFLVHLRAFAAAPSQRPALRLPLSPAATTEGRPPHM